jgi:hypothetical protein
MIATKTMTRLSPLPLLVSLTLALLSGCNRSGSLVYPEPPTVEVVAGSPLRTPDLLLPLHRAGIVDLAFVEPRGQLGVCAAADPTTTWRLVSADAEGMLRVWQDGKLCAGVLAHRGGVSALRASPEGALFSAGMDGRVVEWNAQQQLAIVRELRVQSKPSEAPSQAPSARPLGMVPRPITALAVDSERLAFSDGSWVQVWTRGPTPTRIWSRSQRSFVSGLALGSGDALAIALLRESARAVGNADHPLMPLPKDMRAEDLANARAYAAYQHPGASADLVEVVGLPSPPEPGAEPEHTPRWSVMLEPVGPIDSDIALPLEGLLVYREVFGPEETRVIGRSLGDRVHIEVNPRRVAEAPAHESIPVPEQPAAGLADVVIYANSLLSEPIPMGVLLPWFDTLPLSSARELSVSDRWWAIGDGLGQLAIGRHDAGAPLMWVPAAEPVELMGMASGRPLMVSAALEPQPRVVLWDLAAGTTRLVATLGPAKPDNDDPDRPPPAQLIPVELVIDDAGTQLFVSMWSFAGDGLGELHRHPLARSETGPIDVLLERNTSASGASLALTGKGDELYAGELGSLLRRFVAPDWQPQPLQSHGEPLLSSDDHWLAVVTPGRREIYDRRAELQPRVLAHEAVPSDFVAALSREGTLAFVAPLGGGTIERLDLREGELPAIEASGPVTAMVWLPGVEGAGSTLVIGQGEGSIDVLEPGAEQPRALRPSEGGRVWSLHEVSGSQGAFVELDEAGATLHRLGDGASLQLVLASPSALRWNPDVQLAEEEGDSVSEAPQRSDWASGQAQNSGVGQLIAIWRPGAGMPACRIFDGTKAGVIVSSTIGREPDAATLIAQFLRGETPVGCSAEQFGWFSPDGQPAPAPIEPQPIG